MGFLTFGDAVLHFFIFLVFLYWHLCIWGQIHWLDILVTSGLPSNYSVFTQDYVVERCNLVLHHWTGG
jgi:hypothetical protein